MLASTYVDDHLSHISEIEARIARFLGILKVARFHNEHSFLSYFSHGVQADSRSAQAAGRHCEYGIPVIEAQITTQESRTWQRLGTGTTGDEVRYVHKNKNAMEDRLLNCAAGIILSTIWRQTRPHYLKPLAVYFQVNTTTRFARIILDPSLPSVTINFIFKSAKDVCMISRGMLPKPASDLRDTLLCHLVQLDQDEHQIELQPNNLVSHKRRFSFTPFLDAPGSSFVTFKSCAIRVYKSTSCQDFSYQNARYPAVGSLCAHGNARQPDSERVYAGTRPDYDVSSKQRRKHITPLCNQTSEP